MRIYVDMQEFLEPLAIYIRRCRQRSLRSAGWTCQRTFAPGQARLLGMKQETCGGCFVHGFGSAEQDRIVRFLKHQKCIFFHVNVIEYPRWKTPVYPSHSRDPVTIVSGARLGDHSDLRRPGHGDHLASAAVDASVDSARGFLKWDVFKWTIIGLIIIMDPIIVTL